MSTEVNRTVQFWFSRPAARNNLPLKTFSQKPKIHFFGPRFCDFAAATQSSSRTYTNVTHLRFYRTILSRNFIAWENRDKSVSKRLNLRLLYNNVSNINKQQYDCLTFRTDYTIHYRAILCQIDRNYCFDKPPPYHNRFTALIPGPPGWAGARRELLDFMVQGKINRGRHTDHPAGRHSIRTNQCPPPPSPHIFYRPDALPAAQPTVSKHWRQLAHSD